MICEASCLLRNQIFSDICNSLHILLYPEVIFFRTECEIQERIRAVIANLRFLRCNFSLLHSGQNLKILFKNYNAFISSCNIKAWFHIQKNVNFRLQITKTQQMIENYLDTIQSDLWTKFYKNCHCGLGEWWTGQIPCEFQIL